jgi:hypothetical protein
MPLLKPPGRLTPEAVLTRSSLLHENCDGDDPSRADAEDFIENILTVIAPSLAMSPRTRNFVRIVIFNVHVSAMYSMILSNVLAH